MLGELGRERDDQPAVGAIVSKSDMAVERPHGVDLCAQPLLEREHLLGRLHWIPELELELVIGRIPFEPWVDLARYRARRDHLLDGALVQARPQVFPPVRAAAAPGIGLLAELPRDAAD